jgi:hypothetical protein
MYHPPTLFVKGLGEAGWNKYPRDFSMTEFISEKHKEYRAFRSGKARLKKNGLDFPE